MSTLLNRSSSLLGMAKAICQKGPWSVRVSPCRTGESVSTASPVKGKPCFYLYDTLHSKLGIKLPFSHFERAVLQVLNVAPTQLHPNGWAYVRAFELLCEDLGRAPTLGVFFWFYTVKKAEKVGWTSLCSRPKHKLFQPFLANYKKFKTRFFKVTPGNAGPNLLVDQAGRPFFPLSWTHQPAVSITVNLEDLEDWERKFANELSELPLQPSAKIIKGVDYSSHALRELKRKAALMAEEEKQPTATSAEPIAAAEPSPQQATTDEASDTASLVVLNEPAPSPTVEKADDGSPLRFEEHPSEHQQERPSKRPHIEKPITKDVEVKKGTCSSHDFQWDTLLAGNPPSSSVRWLSPLLGQAVDKGLASSFEGPLRRSLGGWSSKIGLLKNVLRRFRRTSSNYQRFMLRPKLKLILIGRPALEEDLQRTIAKNKDLAGKNFDLDMTIDYANAEAGLLRQKNEDLEASNSDLHLKLASAESSLKQALENIQSRDQLIQSRDQTIHTQTQTIKTHEKTVIKMGGDIVQQYETGFAKALEQVHFLHPIVDVSEADPFKEFVDGQLVLVPTPPGSPAPE
ncbi:hypothetical protein CR513_18503, partial [Mucuna pruriens]